MYMNTIEKYDDHDGKLICAERSITNQKMNRIGTLLLLNRSLRSSTAPPRRRLTQLLCRDRAGRRKTISFSPQQLARLSSQRTCILIVCIYYFYMLFLFLITGPNAGNDKSQVSLWCIDYRCLFFLHKYTFF